MPWNSAWTKILLPNPDNPIAFFFFCIIAAIFLAGVIATFYSIRVLAQSRIKAALRVFKGQTRQTIAANYAATRRDLQAIPGFGDQWREYDECLFPDPGRDGAEPRIRNSVNPREFFDENLLFGKYVDSQFIHALPPILTGLGILGTFLGLALGVAGFQVGSSDEIIKSVGGLLGGITVAFATSVWGIAFSLALTLIVAMIYGGARRTHNQLLEVIDELFIRHSEEDYLHRIERINQEQLDRLTTLSTDLVEPLEEALGRAMDKAMENHLKPSLDAMVSSAGAMKDFHERSTNEAMVEMVDRFVQNLHESTSESAAKLREAMEAASQGVVASAGLMEQVVNKLHAAIREQLNAQDSLTDVTGSLAELHEQFKVSTGALDEATQRTREAMKEMQAPIDSLGVASGQVREAIDRQSRELTEFHERSLQIAAKIETVSTLANDLWAKHSAGFEALNQALDGGVQSFTEETKSSLKGILGSFDQELSRAIQNFRSTIEDLDDRLEQLTDILERAANVEVAEE